MIYSLSSSQITHHVTRNVKKMDPRQKALIATILSINTYNLNELMSNQVSGDIGVIDIELKQKTSVYTLISTVRKQSHTFRTICFR
ncbi:hypothetical protein GDO78_010675 [Eleutherodactylus coqui]|uniref:Uncharacterized protein n=1 Tax=Eleutherodactylus coqui TaxID=57060 RepID=A0A8J6F6G6_ELECQ|nr:hypothetical protein GDO78_010675 [Eleutherodactylus coqui]